MCDPYSLIRCSFVPYLRHKLSLQPRQNRSNLPALNNADLQSHYILGAQKKRLIEMGLLSTHNIRGHMFWLKIIKGKYQFSFKDKSFTMVSFGARNRGPSVSSQALYH